MLIDDYKDKYVKYETMHKHISEWEQHSQDLLDFNQKLITELMESNNLLNIYKNLVDKMATTLVIKKAEDEDLEIIDWTEAKREMIEEYLRDEVEQC